MSIPVYVSSYYNLIMLKLNYLRLIGTNMVKVAIEITCGVTQSVYVERTHERTRENGELGASVCQARTEPVRDGPRTGKVAGL